MKKYKIQRERKYLPMLGIELFRNVRLLIHGDCYQSVQPRKKKDDENGKFNSGDLCLSPLPPPEDPSIVRPAA